MNWRVVIKGKRSEWGLPVSKETALAMKEDGFEVYEIVNSVPAWAADLGLTRLLVFAQDVWNWPSKWGKQ